MAELANSIDFDEVAHIEPPHLDLCCLPSILSILNMIYFELTLSFFPINKILGSIKLLENFLTFEGVQGRKII